MEYGDECNVVTETYEPTIVVTLISRAEGRLVIYPRISYQSSVTYNGQYHRHVVKAQPYFPETQKGKHMSNMLRNGVI